MKLQLLATVSALLIVSIFNTANAEYKTYSSRDLYFKGDNGSYSQSRAEKDFGNFFSYSDGEKNRTRIQNNRLRIKQLKNKVQTGVKTVIDIPYRSTYTLEYKVKFESGFDPTLGGKLPGFCGGDCNSGGDRATDGKGFSARVMWRDRDNGSKLRLVPYVYHRDMPGTYGDEFNSSYNIQKDRWYTVKINVVLNTGSNRNGELYIRVDGAYLVYKGDIRYITDNSKRDIRKILFDVWHGGNDSNFYPSKDQYIFIDNVKWRDYWF